MQVRAEEVCKPENGRGFPAWNSGKAGEVLMFCISGKEMGAPTGNWLYDSARELTEMASTQFAFYGLMNPYTYQRPKITPLPNETGLTVPGGTGVAVVPNGTAPALKQPYLPGQYTEYPAAVQGWAQQALPGWGSGIESGSSSVNDIVDIMKSGNMTADGRNIITQLDENTKVIFRMDVGENAHSMEMYGYSNPVNHINIEIQVKASSGKYKPKWNFHMILDNLGEVSDSFATGIWTKK